MRSFSAPTAIPSSGLPQYQVQNSFSQQNQAFLNSMAQPTFSLMPAVSYSTIPLGTSPTSTNAMLGSNMIQSQQPVIFSAAPGNYFLAQSAPLGAPVVGAPSFVFAPGQPNQNAFVLAHPLSQAPIAGHMAAHPNPANCVIRLPDGRFVLPASAPNNLNLQPSLTRICGPQSNYFPVTVSAPTSVNSSTISSLTPQVAQPPGQAFYIHMPTSCVSVGNTVFTTSQPNCGANFQTQPISTMKPGCQVSFPNSQMNTLSGQSGTFLTTVPGSTQPQLGTRPLANNMNTVGSGLMNRPGIIFPTGCTPTTPVMDAYAAQNQQKLAVCTNPSQFTSLQALPSGMAVARLPNGTYATVSLNSTGMSGSTPIFVNNTPIPSTLANPVDTSSNIPRRSTSTSRSKQKINNTPPADTDVLRRLDDQITALQRLPAPTEMQLNRLKQLVEVRQQLTKVSNMASANSSNILAPRSSTTSSNATNTAPRSNSSSTSVQLTPTVRREVLDLLTQYNLVPRPPVVNNNEETFIVEFRLNQQRYQLRLTRAQKADMERLLFSITSQRQAEVLTFFQQEQSRLLASTPRARLPPPPSVSQSSNTTAAMASPPTVGFGIASQALRIPTGIQTFAAAPSLPMPNFPGASGLRLVAARPVVPPNAIPGSAVRPSVPPICSSTPVMGVVAALAVPPPMGTCVSSSMFAPALALNSTALSMPTVSSSLSMPSTVMSNTNVTSGLITAIPVTSFNSSFYISSTMLTPDTNGFAIQSLPQSTSFTLSSDSSNFVNSIRPVALNLQQAARIGRLRAYLTNDLKLAVERPPVLSTSDTSKLPTPVELLEALAPYHVLNDADNTEEALNKVDKILEKSVNLLLEKKKETIEAVNSLLFRESLQKLEPFLEDRLLLANMALDLERDIFNAEKEIFTEVTKHDKEVSSNNCNPNVNPIESSKQDESTDENNVNRKRQSQKFTPILKHSTSLLPAPWCKLLGPLAYLHPLTFDVNGKTSVAEIQLPTEEPECISLDDDDDDGDDDTKNQSQSFVNSSTFQSNPMIQSSHSENNNSTIVTTRNNNNDDEEINDESSDEAEADRLLGLGIPLVNRSKMDKNSTNGLLLDEDNRPIEGIIKKCEEFDEAYDFWQELMHERDMHIEDMNTSLLENTFNDDSNSMDEPPNKSLRLLDNGQSHSVSTVQHSEDPDIDAAIRSILSTSD
uniref:GLTSCR protein conserved domain-containing protein n=1 Tax=Trichobilharzia regenti TaxID=157069 RepID=A0AA85K5T4_TRIRE|nr:unnamed protein product [Trichobilharzia regenti]